MDDLNYSGAVPKTFVTSQADLKIAHGLFGFEISFFKVYKNLHNKIITFLNKRKTKSQELMGKKD